MRNKVLQNQNVEEPQINAFYHIYTLGKRYGDRKKTSSDGHSPGTIFLVTEKRRYSPKKINGQSILILGTKLAN